MESFCVMNDEEYVNTWKKDLYGRLNDVKIEALDLSQRAEKAMNKLMRIQTKNDMENFIQEIVDIDADLYRVSVDKL